MPKLAALVVVVLASLVKKSKKDSKFAIPKLLPLVDLVIAPDLVAMMRDASLCSKALRQVFASKIVRRQIHVPAVVLVVLPLEMAANIVVAVTLLNAKLDKPARISEMAAFASQGPILVVMVLAKAIKMKIVPHVPKTANVPTGKLVVVVSAKPLQKIVATALANATKAKIVEPAPQIANVAKAGTVSITVAL